jgi:acetyl-CoA acetyltransferase
MSTVSLRNSAVVLGVGESEIGQVPGMTGLGLNAQAARRAVEDAGLQPSDIDGLLTAYSFTEPYFMLGSVLAEYLGLKPVLCASVVSGGASPAVMIGHAAAAIAAGRCRAVLICCGENRATGLGRDDAVAALTAVGHPWYEAPYGAFIPALYALIARRHMHEAGTTPEQMAAVAVQSRRHAGLHPYAHKRTPITIEEVVGAKRISDPLGLLDCCLISDAAGAIVVVAPELAKESKRSGVWLHGIGEHHTHEHLIAAPSLTQFGAVESGRRAYEMAGLGPDDMDVAMLYDCFTIVPIIEAEELGLCPPGRAGSAFAAGEFALGGRLPVNTHGGMLSHAHAGAAGGLFGVVEAVRQLRNECDARQVESAEIALVHNEGGILSSHCTLVLGRERR